MKQDIYLVGGGGHCKSCLDVVRATGQFNVLGIIDIPENRGVMVCGTEVVAADHELVGLVSDPRLFLVTVGFVESPQVRIKLFEQLQSLNARMPVIVSPKAYVSSYAEVGSGSIVMHGALVNASASIGRNCIINSNALVEHDAVIGDHCHISTGAIVNGGCQIEAEVFLGSNAVLAQVVRVASGVIIGAGTVVHKDITQPGVYAGNPMRKLR